MNNDTSLIILSGDSKQEAAQAALRSAIDRIETRGRPLVLTDPPYSSLEKHRSRGTTTRLSQSKSSSNEWFKVLDTASIAHVLSMTMSELRINCNCFCFAGWDGVLNSGLYKQTQSNLSVPNSTPRKVVRVQRLCKEWDPLVWVKTKKGKNVSIDDDGDDLEKARSMGMGYHGRKAHELIAYFEWGKAPLVHKSMPSVLFGPTRLEGYPTQKPLGVLIELICAATVPGGLVVDPFCGSGAVGVAAALCGRNAIVSDLRSTQATHESIQEIGKDLWAAGMTTKAFALIEQTLVSSIDFV